MFSVIRHDGDVSVLFTLLVIVAFAAAIWLAVQNRIAAALAVAFIALVLFIYVL